MILRDLLYSVSEDKRKRERVKAAQEFAVGMGVVAVVGVAIGFFFAPKAGKETREELKKHALNTVKTIIYTVQKKAETVKDSEAHVVQDIKGGCHEMTQEIHKTDENI